MAARDIDDLYTRQIQPLLPESRLRLLALIAVGLASGGAGAGSGTRSLLELEGLGAGIWRGGDADAYVRRLREEWSEYR